MQAKDVMTMNVVTVSPDTLVNDIAKLLIERRISAVPVVAADGRVVGIVSEGDLMRRPESETEERHVSWWLKLFADQGTLAGEYAKSHGRHASEIMTGDVVTVSESTPVAEIAQILEEKHIKRVPVVENDRLVGIVSRANLLHGLATHKSDQPSSATGSDRSIRERLLEQLGRESWVSLPYINVTVTEGVVHLWGFVESANVRKALGIAAESVDGVRSVENHLSLLQPWIYSSE